MAKKKTTQAPPVPDWFREQFRNRYFVCYLDWAPILSALENPADYKRVMEAAFQYADTGAVPQLARPSRLILVLTFVFMNRYPPVIHGMILFR